MLLSEVVRTQRSPREVGLRSGRRRAQEMNYEGGTLSVLQEDLAAGGFRPVPVPHADGGDFVLLRCPFVEVAVTDPATVCQVHLGLAQGVVAELGQGAVVDLVASDPRRAGCRIKARFPTDPRQVSA